MSEKQRELPLCTKADITYPSASRSYMNGEELLTVCAKIRAYHEQGRVGALAIVCTPAQTVTFARLLGALAAAVRPIEMLPDCNRRGPGWTTNEVEAACMGRHAGPWMCQ